MGLEFACAFGVVAVWMLILTRKRQKPGESSKNVRRFRHKRAVKVAVLTNVAALVVLIGVVIAVCQLQSSPVSDVRATEATIGSIVLSGWLGLLGYGITRLIYRTRSGPVLPGKMRPPPAAPPPPDFSGLE